MKYELEVGSETEECLQFVLNSLSDEQVDAIDVERNHEDLAGVASEPVTVYALLSIPPELVTSVVYLISQWVLLQHRRGNKQIDADTKIRLAEIKYKTDIALAATEADKNVSIAEISAQQDENRLRAENEVEMALLAKFDGEMLEKYGSIKAKNVSLRKI